MVSRRPVFRGGGRLFRRPRRGGGGAGGFLGTDEFTRDCTKDVAITESPAKFCDNGSGWPQLWWTYEVLWDAVENSAADTTVKALLHVV